MLTFSFIDPIVISSFITKSEDFEVRSIKNWEDMAIIFLSLGYSAKAQRKSQKREWTILYRPENQHACGSPNMTRKLHP